MDKGEGIMATPQGDITSTETWSGQAPAGSAEELDAIIDNLIAEADKEEAVEEYDDFDPEQV
jgi:hypothetical protein